MPDRDPRRLAAWGAAALVLMLLAAWYLGRGRPAADAAALPPAATIVADAQPEAESGKTVIVDVAGAVARPGVYELPAGARVEDALQRAGGAKRRADLAQINRAAILEDGRQILVPLRGRPTADAGAAPPAAASPGAAGAAAGGVVNLNSATLEELQLLDGVGPVTAQKIVEYREQHGGFRSVEELDQVSGIGEKRLAALRDRVGV